MTLKTWLAAAFGLALASVIQFAIDFDIQQVRDKQQTISRWVLDYSCDNSWFPFLLSAFATTVVSILATHLFKSPCSGDSLLMSTLGMWAGIGFGMMIAFV